MHANASEILCAITRYAPPGLAAKICSPRWLFLRIFCCLTLAFHRFYQWVFTYYFFWPLITIINNHTLILKCSFVGRLFRHALEDSRPKSVLVHSLSVCVSLLDPKRLLSSSYQSFRSQLSHGTMVAASPETVDGMLESLGRWLLLLVECCNLKL